MFNQLGLIGCGLMGGSFALALKKAGLVKRVVGYSKSPSTVEKARRLGVIDVAAELALLAVSGSANAGTTSRTSISRFPARACSACTQPQAGRLSLGCPMHSGASRCAGL